ncbi:SURP and G-patch domain-containing protein 1-like protein [Tetrabaena socialis]|uniref:SURP and G-patch domain-containing protein 1-like protein n=1 Tax=Tetrabaena socialis TaxID=47790 RepID=A0A2J8AJZ4_9CHLO|nr:SURP and G-patch domain-containing protein 1-like protein [Tetrabaena socialis]|eukprot:PNH12842.1 SURP and G-patch domain-containing protein 1-like protein [Tetrabaena socialis]
MSGLNFSLKRPLLGGPKGAKIAMPPKKPATAQETGAGAYSSSQLAARLDADTVLNASKLADFVAKNGRQFEGMTRDRNVGETPFKFLHDVSSLGYQFYAAKLRELEASNGTAAAPPPPLPPSALPAPPPLPSGPGPVALDMDEHRPSHTVVADARAYAIKRTLRSVLQAHGWHAVTLVADDWRRLDSAQRQEYLARCINSALGAGEKGGAKEGSQGGHQHGSGCGSGCGHKH